MNKILPVFLPLVACGNKCAFCDQHAITNTITEKDIFNSAKNQIEKWLTYSNNYHEIAFYGGNFGAIKKSEREKFYNLAFNLGIKNIRFSTRVDTITNELLEEISKFNINFVELGVQSLDENVLKLNYRPYKKDDVFKSIENLNQVTNCGIQLMTDMYGQNKFMPIDDAKILSQLNIKTVRIYPTQVYKNTELYNLYQQGKYNESNFIDTLLTVTGMYIIFTSENIKVIRIGLPQEAIENENRVAGIHHNAFGDLVKTLSVLLYFESGYSCKFYGYKSIVKEIFKNQFPFNDNNYIIDFINLCKKVRSNYLEDSKWFFESKANYFAKELKSKTDYR